MKADLAAAYCGVSKSGFLANAGPNCRYPAGSKIGDNRIWYREDLDSALDRLKEGGEPSGDPYDEALNVLDERETHQACRR
jgi:hypothetical protein